MKCKLQGSGDLGHREHRSFSHSEKVSASSVGEFPVEQIHNIFYVVFAKSKSVCSNDYINSFSRDD